MSLKPVRQVKSAPKFRRYVPAERKQQLVRAAIECLAEGGIAGFTVERICKKAGISRGLISHHFDGKDALLVAAYDAMTVHLTDLVAIGLGQSDGEPVAALRETIAANFSTDLTDQPTLKAWLAVWGEVASNGEMKSLHRKRYDVYRANLAAAIDRIAQERGRRVDANQLATAFIALIDGLWLEWCLDPAVVSQEQAEAACYALLEPHLGPL